MQTDVIIIGAGAAGLAAAKELTKKGVSFIVIEASHRIGGRAYCEEIGPNTWFDLGCAYMVEGKAAKEQNDESNPFIEIAKQYGAHVEENLTDQHYIYNGAPLSDEQEKGRIEYFNECELAIRQSAENGMDCAISDVIDLDSPYAIPYNDMMTVTAPKDVDEISVADTFHGVEQYVEYISTVAYGNVVTKWGSDIDVSLTTKVEKIDWTGKEVVAETSKGSIKARYLISTVSNGILAAQHIEFKPRLPDWKMDAIQGVTMGAENKIGIHFTKDIFGDETSGLFQSWSDDGQGSYMEVNLLKSNVANVFIGGRFSQWMEKQGQQACHEYAVDQIAEVFGNKIRNSVGRVIVTAWNTDPWTLGSYAAALPGQYHQREALRRAIDDKLFFAGEATARAHGTCNGAYWSGVRAATEVIGIIKQT